MTANSVRAGNNTLNKTAGGLNDTLSHKSVLEKQRAAIEKLRYQNAKLKEELLLENKFSVRPSDPGAARLINKLQDEADLYTRKIELEKRKVGMLGQQLEDINSKLSNTRSKMGGINSAREKSTTFQKQTKILENRLEKAYIKYNEAITRNKQLREQIDNMRMERMMFENISTSLERELLKIKRDMAEVIEQANSAFQAKEKVLSEIGAVKTHADKEQQGYEEEWKHLTHIIEDDRKQREVQRAQEMAERERKTQQLLKSCDSANAARKKQNRGIWHNNVAKVMAQNVSYEKVAAYGQAFEKIQNATGIKDIDELVEAFVNAEDRNYTLFNYVNEVNAEVEKLEDQINAVKAEMQTHQEQDELSSTVRHQQLSQTLGKLHDTESTAELYERRTRAAQSTVEALKSSITTIFNAIGCDTPTVRDLLGEAELSESNLLAYLGIIEQRTNELVQAFAMRKGPEASMSEMFAVTQGPAPSHRIVIEPPSTTHDEPPASDDDGDDIESLPEDQPLTRECIEQKVHKNLERMMETSLKLKAVGVDTPVKGRGRK